MHLTTLRERGQSAWLDDLDRGLLTSGELARLVAEDVTGLASNPSTFEKALADRRSHAADVARFCADPQPATGGREALYEALTIADLRQAADLLRPVWERTGGRDGQVSLEIAPRLADDPIGTVDAARRLWIALDRPNAMIKVPRTLAALPAITQLAAEAIPVNVTLLFDPERYTAVAEAWLTGLERRRDAGHDPANIAAVASFFVSRIDVAVDARLDALAADRAELAADCAQLRGRVALALAAATLGRYAALRRSARWHALETLGAAPQRLLWASTGTKDPRARDVRYVEALVAPDTVITLPRATLRAFLDHGEPGPSVDPAASEHAAVLAKVAALGVALPVIARELEREGLDRFAEDWEAGLGRLDDDDE